MKISGMKILPAVLVLLSLSSAPAWAAEKLHALAMHGTPKYAADFAHFDYVNPDAPKGGELRMGAYGTFDNLNPFIIKGTAAPGVNGLVYQTLLTSSDDEPFTEYGLLAESIEMPDDRSYVVFNLRPQARWHDGKPVTAEDVVWTFNTLMKDGHPQYRAYYSHVKEAVAEGARRVRFNFSMAGNRELPLIMGQLPVLPKHVWQGRDFSATTQTPPVGSGPYRVKSVEQGRKIVFERVPDWWAADLPVMKGRYNFDVISYDMFRDETVLLQALFAGAYDFRQENIAKAWESEYNIKPVEQGLLVKAELPHGLPAGMQGFVFNIRRDVFKDPRVRAALNYAFDFEWSNKQFAFGKYRRSNSYFTNSDLAATGLPSPAELALLEPFRDRLPPEVFSAEYKNPETDGSGRGLRANMRTARDLLEQAGWKIGKGGMLEKDGKPFTFEILLYSESFVRWISPLVANLKKLGIAASVRVVDTVQYQKRTDTFDFDMIVMTFGQSLSPGNEQLDYWGSASAGREGSRNLIGIKDPVIDALIEKIIVAETREDLIAASRALDRVLLWGHYVIPNWYIDYFRLAYWNKFGQPAVRPKYAVGVVDTWWYDAGKAADVAAKIKPKP